MLSNYINVEWFFLIRILLIQLIMKAISQKRFKFKNSNKDSTPFDKRWCTETLAHLHSIFAFFSKLLVEELKIRVYFILHSTHVILCALIEKINRNCLSSFDDWNILLFSKGKLLQSEVRNFYIKNVFFSVTRKTTTTNKSSHSGVVGVPSLGFSSPARAQSNLNTYTKPVVAASTSSPHTSERDLQSKSKNCKTCNTFMLMTSFLSRKGVFKVKSLFFIQYTTRAFNFNFILANSN